MTSTAILKNDSTPITRSVSVVESNDSRSAYLEGDAWDNKKIRGLTDIVRECIEVSHIVNSFVHLFSFLY